MRLTKPKTVKAIVMYEVEVEVESDRDDSVEEIMKDLHLDSIGFTDLYRQKLIKVEESK